MVEGTSSGLTGWLPAATAIIEFLSSQVLEWFKDRRTHKRERESRLEARRDRVLERRNEEQRQILLDLQDALHNLMQAAGSAHSQDERVHSAGGSRSQTYRHQEIISAHGAAQSKTMMLAVRVRDEGIRKMTDSLKIECILVDQAKNKRESDENLGRHLFSFSD